MVNLQYRIFTSEIDIIEWDWNKFKPRLFTNNGYCQLLMFCCHCPPCISPFHKNLRSQILVPSPYLPDISSDKSTDYLTALWLMFVYRQHLPAGGNHQVRGFMRAAEDGGGCGTPGPGHTLGRHLSWWQTSTPRLNLNHPHYFVTFRA